MKKPRDLRLSALLELSQTLGATLHLRSSLGRVLEILEQDLATVTGAVTLLEGSVLHVEAASGVGAEAERRAHFRAGEGITGRVVSSGKPVAVPQASREPLFLDRRGLLRNGRKRRELSFLCVPIRADAKPAGALAVTIPYEAGRDLGHDLELLAVVASMIGQALRVNRLVEGEKSRLAVENRQLKQELRERYDLGNIVGNSRPMQQVYEEVAQAAPSSSTTVLIRGESGTGKELIAHAIHYNSPRAGKPFVKVSCAALPESLIESELFGYEPGAFTDARAQKKGRFELANGGTLFLDEVGELPLATQVKLLRVLQEREFERLGGVHAVKVNVRLVAATNRDLEAALKVGTFREDLYYRLKVFEIFLPPLRDRKPDILLLADHFVEKYAVASGKDVRRISTTAIDMLMSYHWPGNVRELENCIERAVLVCDGGVLHAHHLPPSLQTAEVSGTLPSRTLKDAVGAYEKDLILDAMKIARGNRAKAARLLGTTERILGYKVQVYGIDLSRFR